MKTIDLQTLETITGGNTATSGLITGLPVAQELGRRAGEEIGRRAGSIWDQIKRLPSPTFPTPTFPSPTFPTNPFDGIMNRR